MITDTIPLAPSRHIPKIKVLSVAPLIGEAIKRIHRGESVGALFSSEVSFTQEMLLWEDGRIGRDGRHRAHLARRRRTISDARIGRRVAPATTRRPMSLQLHRPDGKGGLEVRTGRTRNGGAASVRRAGARRSRAASCPGSTNPEMNPTSTARAVAFWVVLALITFVIDRRRLRLAASGASSHREPDRGHRRPGVTMRRALICTAIAVEGGPDLRGPTPGGTP